MLSQNIIRQYARALDEAEQSRQQIEALTQTYPNMTLEDAYQVQKAWIDMKLARGRKKIGKKIGLTSRAMQLAMKIDEPDFGVLLDDMAFENECELVSDNFLDPRVEVEFGFKLKKTLSGEALSLENVLQATHYIQPMLEIIAARSYRVHTQTNYTRTIYDTISDNAASAAFIVGGEKMDPHKIDLAGAGAALYRNGEVEETGLGAGILGHPANALIWLAKRLAPFGESLQAGEVILAGSFTRPVVCRAGDRFLADYGRLGKIGFTII